MIKRAVLVFISVLIIFVFSACGPGENGDEEFTIVTTLFPQYDFAKAIVGDKGTVKLLLPPGADSHSFELTASDIAAISKCDVFIYTGPGMEIWADNVIDSVGADVTVVNLSEAVVLSSSKHHDHSDHEIDPHIWTSPVNAIGMLKTIYEAVCSVDEDNAEYYLENYQRYLSDLDALDKDFADVAEESAGQTLYFSGKFAFSYFVKEYGFDYVAPFDSCSDLQVEDLASVANLIEQLKTNNVKYIFYEEFANDAVYKTIAAETGAEPLLLHSAHNVSKEEFDSGVTYLRIMKDNLLNIKKALNYDKIA